VTFYHDKSHFDPLQRNLYAEFAQEFSLQQGRHFCLQSSGARANLPLLSHLSTKTSRLKEQIKELDHLNSGPCKVVWLTHKRLFVLMQDATIVWLSFDAMSGDLLKSFVDRSLSLLTVDTTSSNVIKLSGGVLCDSAILPVRTKLHDSGFALVLAYKDKAKIDIITFQKSKLFAQHLYDGKLDYVYFLTVSLVALFK
jgi:hypothetical protein